MKGHYILTILLILQVTTEVSSRRNLNNTIIKKQRTNNTIIKQQKANNTIKIIKKKGPYNKFAIKNIKKIKVQKQKKNLQKKEKLSEIQTKVVSSKVKTEEPSKMQKMKKFAINVAKVASLTYFGKKLYDFYQSYSQSQNKVKFHIKKEKKNKHVRKPKKINKSKSTKSKNPIIVILKKNFTSTIEPNKIVIEEPKKIIETKVSIIEPKIAENKIPEILKTEKTVEVKHESSKSKEIKNQIIEDKIKPVTKIEVLEKTKNPINGQKKKIENETKENIVIREFFNEIKKAQAQKDEPKASIKIKEIVGNTIKFELIEN